MDFTGVNIEGVSPALLSGLKPYLLLDFFDFPYLVVSVNNTNSYFLNYYIDGNDIHNRILIDISFDKLKSFVSKQISLKDCFNKPENGYVYYAQFDKSDNVISLELILENEFSNINPIDKDYQFTEDIDLSLLGNENSETLLTHSKQSQRVIVDVYLRAFSLKSSLKYWAIKSFLVPFMELIRISLLNNTNVYTIRNLDENVNLGLTKLKVASLATTIEFGSAGNLFETSKDALNLENLFLMMNTTDKDKLIESVGRFQDTKIVREYVKVLNIIVRQNATLDTKLATPEGIFIESNLDKNKAIVIKKIIDEFIPIESTEEIQGTLYELAFNKKEPTFSMSASFEDYGVRGHIDSELVERLKAKQQEFVFFTKQYNFTIYTKYNSATSMSQSRITTNLIDINEVKEDIKESINDNDNVSKES